MKGIEQGRTDGAAMPPNRRPRRMKMKVRVRRTRRQATETGGVSPDEIPRAIEHLRFRKMYSRIEWGISNGIKSLEEVLDFIASRTSQDSGKVPQSSVEESARNRTEQDRQEYVPLPPVERFLYSSVLIAAFSFLEFYLDITCRILEDLRTNGNAQEYVEGRGLERFKTHLKTAGYRRSFFDGEPWSDTKMLEEIRNALVHDQGITAGRRRVTALCNYVTSHPKFFNPLVFHGDMISPKRPYCDFSLRNVRTLLLAVLEEASRIADEWRERGQVFTFAVWLKLGR